MTALVELARAKVNLTLAVCGRRPDGYHELDSLVAFADVADDLRLDPGVGFTLSAEGPFASAIEGENLIAKAVRLLQEANGRLATGRFHLTKRLPVAAGIGGGSADAAAALRLVRQANPARADAIDWHDIARRVGADVPVCLEARAQRLQGIGERLSPVPALPPVAVLLANPRIPLATADVFRALAASQVGRAAAGNGPRLPPAFRDPDHLIDWLMSGRNDLEPAALRICPAISQVIARLAALPGARLVRMSGSGPTCFAVFASLTQARQAEAKLALAEPQWWTAAATLR
jgi:4-diphosphocytidyl-2-C-methyl-D-erythritol kinase